MTAVKTDAAKENDDFLALFKDELEYQNDGYFFTKIADTTEGIDGRLFIKRHKLNILHLLVPVKTISGYSQYHLDYSKKQMKNTELILPIKNIEIQLEMHYEWYGGTFIRSKKQYTFSEPLDYSIATKLKVNIEDVKKFIVDQSYYDLNTKQIKTKKMLNWKACMKAGKFNFTSDKENGAFKIISKITPKPRFVLTSVHHLWPAKLFFDTTSTFWTPPNATSKTTWLKINLSNYVLDSNRMINNKSVHDFESDVEWFRDLLQNVSFNSLISNSQNKNVEKIYMFNFRSDRLEIRKGTFYMSKKKPRINRN